MSRSVFPNETLLLLCFNISDDGVGTHKLLLLLVRPCCKSGRLREASSSVSSCCFFCESEDGDDVDDVDDVEGALKIFAWSASAGQ